MSEAHVLHINEQPSYTTPTPTQSTAESASSNHAVRQSELRELMKRRALERTGQNVRED